MDFNLSKEEQLIQKAAREFAQKVIDPAAAEIDKTNLMPSSILEGLSELGMFGIPLPDEYGGGGAGYLSYILALEQLSRACSGVGMIISVNVVGLSVINTFGTPEQKKKYLPPGIKGSEILSFAFTEPGTGSDPKQLTTTVRKDGDHFVISGTKRFISNAGYKGPMIVIAREEESGNASAFIIDKFCSGYALSEPWDKIGAHGGALYDVYLNDVRISEGNLLGERGQGLWALKIAMVYGKIGLAGLFLGSCLAAWEEALSYARLKTHRGEAIAAKFQHIQTALADIAMKYDAAKWYTYHLGFAADHYKDPMQLVKEAALTKVYVAETAIDIARIAMGIHGSYGVMRDYKIARLWGDVILGPQVEGTAPLLKILAAGVILDHS
jgi:alkylation response protein AidB-like acyl-CoA dehydrogenase